MELSEIFDKIISVAQELEIDEESLQEYQIHLSISSDSEDNGIVSDVEKGIEIDENEKIIYVTVTLY